MPVCNRTSEFTMKRNNRINGKNINAISMRQGRDCSRLELGVNAQSDRMIFTADIRVLEKVETK